MDESVRSGFGVDAEALWPTGYRQAYKSHIFAGIL
jgi:hypothetical protein